MFIPLNEADYVLLTRIIRPPRHDDSYDVFSSPLADAVCNVIGCRSVELKAIRHNELIGRALELRAVGRFGGYSICLLHLALKGDALACMLVAANLIQWASQNREFEKRATFRALRWLRFGTLDQDDRNLLLLPERIVQHISASRNASSLAGIQRKNVELRNRRITVVAGKLDKWVSEANNSKRYERLAEPLKLSGDISSKNFQTIIGQLRAEYPWAQNLIYDIKSALNFSVSTGNAWLNLPPLLLVGPPGIGKTRFARRLSETCGVALRTINAGGLGDNRDFSGTARGWGSAQPSRIVDILLDTECANPIVLVDEVDKAGRDRSNGSITNSLLTMLEPETKAAFFDEALRVRIDLSFVNWIITANDVGQLGEPFLSRVRLVRMDRPPISAANQIIDTIAKDIGRRLGLPSEAMPELAPEVRSALINAIAKGAAPRSVAGMVEHVFAIEMERRRAS
jgi:hypothetical protein